MSITSKSAIKSLCLVSHLVANVITVKGIYAHCENGGGWILGHLVDGTQAEYVKVPFADNSLYHTPTSLPDEALVMLSDILPTGYEIGVLKGKVKPGSTVAIVGAGPVGLASLLTAQFYSPSKIIMIDLDDHRLATAKNLERLIQLILVM